MILKKLQLFFQNMQNFIWLVLYIDEALSPAKIYEIYFLVRNMDYLLIYFPYYIKNSLSILLQ